MLLIEDDRALSDALTLGLEDGGHAVIAAFDGREGLTKIERDKPDVVLCDVGLPRLDGFSLCRMLRERGDQVPLILLTARDSEIDQALGLELGADDYVIKPVSVRVLLARITALLRRSAARRSNEDAAAKLVAGDLTIDRERLEARWRGQALVTTVTELRLLEGLASRPGIVLSRGRLLELARGDEGDVTERLVDAYVRRLRKKLTEIDPEFAAIETVIGAGYRFVVAAG